MDKVNSTLSLGRTKSDQPVETMAAVGMKSPSGDAVVEGSGLPPPPKSSRRTMSGSSPGRTNSSRNYNSHIRKARSAQLQKLDIDEVSSGAALSRASSASFGLSFSFTGFTMPPEDIADSKPYSDDDSRKS